MNDARSLTDNLELIIDCCRYSGGLLSEAAVKKKYRFTDDVWTRLGEDEPFVEAIEAEKLRRVRNGSAKRELAQKHVARAADILNSIMCDERASPRHRVDSVKALDALAGGETQAAPEQDRFRIVINLGADQRLVFDKAIKPDAPRTIDHAPQELLPIIAAKKDSDDDGSRGGAW